MVVGVWSAMVSRFTLEAYFQEAVLKIDQVTMKHDPFDAM